MDTPKATFYVIKLEESYQRYDIVHMFTPVIADSLFYHSLEAAHSNLELYFKHLPRASIVKIDLFEHVEKSHLDARIVQLQQEIMRLKALKGR